MVCSRSVQSASSVHQQIAHFCYKPHTCKWPLKLGGSTFVKHWNPKLALFSGHRGELTRMPKCWESTFAFFIFPFHILFFDYMMHCFICSLWMCPTHLLFTFFPACYSSRSLTRRHSLYLLFNCKDKVQATLPFCTSSVADVFCVGHLCVA